jgi:hypothetical protein
VVVAANDAAPTQRRIPMSKLTDTQLIILSAASQRDDRGVELPANVKGDSLAAVTVDEVAFAPSTKSRRIPRPNLFLRCARRCPEHDEKIVGFMLEAHPISPQCDPNR